MKISDTIDIIVTQSLENGIELSPAEALHRWSDYCQNRQVGRQPELTDIRDAFEKGYFGIPLVQFAQQQGKNTSGTRLN